MKKRHVGQSLLDATKLNDAKKVYDICREYAGNHSVLHCQDSEADDFTPLHFACERGHQKIIMILLAAGADVNFAVKTHDATPISQALYFYDPSEGPYALRILLACDEIDVNKPCFNGALPIFEATRQKKYDCVQALVEAGADVHVKGKDGRSLVNLALHGELDKYGPCACAVMESASIASEEKAVFDMAKTKHEIELQRNEGMRKQHEEETKKLSSQHQHQWAASRGGGERSYASTPSYAVAAFGDGGGGWGWGGGGGGGGDDDDGGGGGF